MENEIKERKKNNKWWLIIFIGIVILLLYFVMTTRFYELFSSTINNKENKKDPNIDNKIEYDDYVYKIRYDFGGESYIYLFKDNTIKTVFITPVYELCSEMNCMDSTGKFDYQEETVNFSSEVKNKVVEVFNDLYKVSGKKEFNAKNIELTTHQQRILLGVVTNDEDSLTIENHIEYEKIKEESKNQKGEVYFTNEKLVMKNNTSNKTVNTIADYLNKIVDTGFAEDKEYVKDMPSETIEYTGVLFAKRTLSLEYVGPFSLSFKYMTDANLGGHAIYDIKGYVFDYNGKLKEVPGGYKDKIFNAAVQEFMKSDIYKEFSQDLESNWKTELKKEMFKTGNWYITEGKIIFDIDCSTLKLAEYICSSTSIEVSYDEKF